MMLTLAVASALAVLSATSMGKGRDLDVEAEAAEVHAPTADRPSHRKPTSSIMKQVVRKVPVTPTEYATFRSPVGTETIAPTGSVSPREAAAFCDALDLVERPDLADDMVRITGAPYGTPPGLLNGIWETESDHGIDGQTGSCDVMDQYAIRDCWKPGATTKRPKGCTSHFIFVGETASATRWKPLPKKRQIGNGTKQERAIIRIADALGISPWSIKGSCGNRILTGLKDPSKGPTHGGCFGNMQITPSEWEEDVLAMGFALSELDPFNVCDSMLVSSYRLRKHHDLKLVRIRKKGAFTAHVDGGKRTFASRAHPDLADRIAWLWAGRRYYGNPDGRKSNTYEFHFKWGRANPGKEDIFTFLEERRRGSRTFPCGWKCWDDMAAANGGRGDFSPLINHIRWRGKKTRERRHYASN